MYAYKFNITSKLSASGALQAGYYQRHLSWDNLVFEDMIDPRLGVVQPTKEKQPTILLSEFPILQQHYAWI